MSYLVGLPNNSDKPIANTAWVRAWLCKLQKWCIRLAAASDKAYQLLVQWSVVLTWYSGFFHH
jgi:transposase